MCELFRDRKFIRAKSYPRFWDSMNAMYMVICIQLLKRRVKEFTNLIVNRRLGSPRW
jgi:hypothetical protein